MITRALEDSEIKAIFERVFEKPSHRIISPLQNLKPDA